MNANSKTTTIIHLTLEMNEMERSNLDDCIWKLRNIVLNSKTDENHSGNKEVHWTDSDGDPRTITIFAEQIDLLSKLYSAI